MRRRFGRFVVAVAGGLGLGMPGSPTAQAATAPVAAAEASDARGSTPDWRLDATAYGWVQGVSGNVTALGHQVTIDASPGELLSHADFPLQGVVSVQHRRLVAIADGSWTPLTVDKGSSTTLPLPPGVTAKVHYSPVLATGELGYRIADVGGYAVDGLAGARYWYLGMTLTLTPSPTGSSLNKSTSWVDPVVGARIKKAIVPRLQVTLLGDVGGWGVGAKLDYQVLAALQLRLKRRWMLDAGWRQMSADRSRTRSIQRRPRGAWSSA